MSKRSAAWQGGEERYGGPSQPEEAMDKPMQATSAQLARRKIAQVKGRRPRSESPMPAGSIFEQANQNGLLGAGNNTANNNTMPPSNPFQSTPSFSFGAANTNGSTQSFGSGGAGGGSFTFAGNTQPTQQSTPNTNSSFNFGMAKPTSPAPFQFGQTNGNTTTSFGQAQSNGEAPKGLFGAAATPQPSNTSFFNGDQTPKPQSNPFGAVQETAKPATSIFSNAQNGSSGFTFSSTFGQKPAETAPSNSFTGFASTQPAQEKPVSDGWSSFLNSKPVETPKPATNGFTPLTTSIFNSQSNGSTNGSSIFSGFGAQDKTTNFKFTAQPEDNDASMMSPENTPQKQSNGIFGGMNGLPKVAEASEPVEQTPKPAVEHGKGPSLFDRITKDAASSQSLFSSPAPVAAPTSSLFNAAAPTSSTAPSESLFSNAAPTPAKSLFSNAAPTPAKSLFTPAPAVSPPKQAVQPSSTPAATSMSTTKEEYYADIRELNEGLLQHINSQDLNKDLTSIFQYYIQEVSKIQKTTTSSTSGFGNNILNKPVAQPVAEPVAQPPKQPSYPTLPTNASNTAKIFEAALDKPAAQSTPSSNSLFASAAAKPTTTSSLFKFTPSTTTTSNSLFAPKPANGFTPAISPATSSFASAFAKQAEANAAKEKKRRRDEEYDSEEDDPQEWEKKDAEEQAEKRRKISEAASTGAKFVPSAGTTSTSNLFNFSKTNGTSAETASNGVTNQKDHTYKQGTPIKFGAPASTTPAAAPKFNLFAAAATPAATNGGSIFANLNSVSGPKLDFSKPSAPTPITNEQAESGDAADEDAAPPEVQMDDMAVLLDSEKAENDVLYHVERTKSRKLETVAVAGGGEKLNWLDKGLGPLWILRNKASGKSRVLQKIKDSGRAVMNFSVLPGHENLYKHEGGKGKAVMATFIDHIANKDSTKLTQWAIMVGKEEDAKSITRILREEQSKA